MALRRKTPTPEPEMPPSLIASAVRMTLTPDSWRGYRFTDESWQRQGWDFYDTNPQLHNAVDYIGAACSLVRIYVAEVDENGVRQGEVDDDPEVAALAETLFGGPASKAEILRALGESLTVAGECYILGRSARPGKNDMWMTAAPSEVRRMGDIVVVDVGRALKEEFSPGRDLVIRVWTPHPRRFMLADSPVRALLNLLMMMQELELVLAGQLKSRLANASILPVPSTLSIPRGDASPVVTDDVYEQLYEVIVSNLEGRGTAAQFAPILWPMPLAELQAMAGIEPIKFESFISDQAIELRKECQQKLAIGMNVPVEIQLGGREMNHWGVWFAGEEFITKSIMPLMNRIVDAITISYLYPALKSLGKDPSRYTYWYDTAPLAATANQLADTLNLYREGVVSADAVLRAAALRQSDKPSKEESQTRFVKEVILRDPTLFAVDAVREAVGVEVETAVPEAELITPPPPPPVPETLPTGPKAGQKPARKAITDSDNEEQLIASVSGPTPVHVAASGAVIRALELANKRLLTPKIRGSFPNTDPLTLHTKLHVTEEQLDTLLAGAWDRLPLYLEGTGYSADDLRHRLDGYVRTLLVRQVEHSPTLLASLLREAGV